MANFYDGTFAPKLKHFSRFYRLIEQFFNQNLKDLKIAK